MRRVYFHCPISSASDDLVLRVSDNYGRDETPLEEVGRTDDRVLYVSGPVNLDWVTDDYVRPEVISLGASFWIDLPWSSSFKPSGKLSKMFPGLIEYHLPSHRASDVHNRDVYGKKIIGTVVEVHFDVEEEV